MNEDKSGDVGLSYGTNIMTAIGKSASFEQILAHENVEEAQEAWDEERAAIIDRVLGEYGDEPVIGYEVGLWGSVKVGGPSPREQAKAGTEAFMEAFEESNMTWGGFLNQQMLSEDTATQATAQAFYRRGQGTTGTAALSLQIQRARAKAHDIMSAALGSDFQGIERLEEGSEERRTAIEAL